MYPHTITNSNITPDIGELADILDYMTLCKQCHFGMVEAVRPFKLDLITIAYICKVFEYLLLLWKCIWLYPHIITTSKSPPDVGKFHEILDDDIVKMMALCYG